MVDFIRHVSNFAYVKIKNIDTNNKLSEFLYTINSMPKFVGSNKWIKLNKNECPIKFLRIRQTMA